MPARKVSLLLVALLIGFGTVMVARPMLSKKPVAETGAPPPAETVEVLVAAHDISSGTLLKDLDIKWQTWPKDGAGDGFAVKGKSETAEYVGAVVRQGLRAGEPILAGRVLRSGEKGFMAAVLAPGMRAVTLSVTPTSSVAGFIFPGDHVDVIITHQLMRGKGEEGSSPRQVSETLLTNARVLALDQRFSDQVTEPKVAQTVTLEVTLKQAESLALAANLGTLSLALRSLAATEEPSSLNTAAIESMQPGHVVSAARDKLLTWDSDISAVLPAPANRSGAVQRVQIMRGKDATAAIFDIQN